MRVQRRGPSTVRITASGDGSLTWNTERRQMEPGAQAAVYVGPAIIGPATAAGREVVAAEDDVTVRTYQVELDLDHPGADDVTSEHVITVTASPDALLEGRVLDITAVDRGDPRRPRILATLND